MIDHTLNSLTLSYKVKSSQSIKGYNEYFSYNFDFSPSILLVISAKLSKLFSDIGVFLLLAVTGSIADEDSLLSDPPLTDDLLSYSLY
jgi:hypothetical protein